MIKLRGFFDGKSIVLDSPPESLKPQSVVFVNIGHSQLTAVEKMRTMAGEIDRRADQAGVPPGRPAMDRFFLNEGVAMIRLRGHFDGNAVVLDDPAPPELKPNTSVEITVPTAREQALQAWQAFLTDWWQRPLPPGFQPTGRSWRREDLHERH